MSTIYDVARAAGVAPSTVSRTFSRPGRVNSVTTERIRRVAAEIGYRTTPLARARSTHKTSMIAVVISDITNPFYFEIIQGAQNAAAQAGYTMLLAHTQESDPPWNARRSNAPCPPSTASPWPVLACQTRRSE